MSPAHRRRRRRRGLRTVAGIGAVSDPCAPRHVAPRGRSLDLEREDLAVEEDPSGLVDRRGPCQCVFCGPATCRLPSACGLNSEGLVRTSFTMPSGSERARGARGRVVAEDERRPAAIASGPTAAGSSTGPAPRTPRRDIAAASRRPIRAATAAAATASAGGSGAECRAHARCSSTKPVWIAPRRTRGSASSRDEERDVGADAENREAAKRGAAPSSAASRVSACAITFASSGIVVDADHVALRRPRSRSGFPGPAARDRGRARPACGRKPAPDPPRRPGTRSRARAATASSCVHGSGCAGGDQQLRAHEIDAGDRLGDRCSTCSRVFISRK